MNPELTREEYSDLIKEYAIMATRFLLIGYGVFFVTLFTTVTGLDETSRWIKPIKGAMIILIMGIAYTGAGISIVIYNTMRGRRKGLKSSRLFDGSESDPSKAQEFQKGTDMFFSWLVITSFFGSFCFLVIALIGLVISIDVPSPTIHIWPKEMLGGV